MKIKSITIRNFRGISKLDGLEIDDLNTFVGKNDSGKSIILKALDCFFNENFTEKDFFKGKNISDKTIIQLSFLLEKEVDDLLLNKEGLFTIKKEYSFDQSKKKIKIDTFYLSNDYEDEKYQDLWNKKESELNKIIESLGAESFRSGSGNTNLERVNLIKSKLLDQKRVDKFHKIGDLFEKLLINYKISLPEYYLFDADESLDVGSSRFQSTFKPIISSCFEKNKEKTDKIEAEIKNDLNKEFEEIKNLMAKNVSGIRELSPSLNCDWKKAIDFDVNFNFEGEKYPVPTSHKGTGFKRLFMVAYFEYLSTKNDVKDKIFAIEEPETYLHPSAQEDLLNSIIYLSSNSQFFITTHSPIFAGASKGENSILVTKDASGLSHYSRGGDQIMNEIIDELGIKPDYNLLHGSKFIIFVEGKDDLEFLKIASKTILNKDLEVDNIITMIGGGSALINYAELKLFKKINPSGNYAVFVDGDNGHPPKIKEKAKLRDCCQNDGALFFQLSKREIENYCSVEKIKEVYQGSRNLDSIQINENTDVENHLKSLGLTGFKKGKNIEVFRKMDINDWKETDPEMEIKSFLEQVYSLKEN